MTWDEIDLGSGSGRCKQSRTKQRREFAVPITDEMLKIIQWAHPSRSEFVLTLTGTAVE